MNTYCIWVLAPSFIFYFTYCFKHCFSTISLELNFLLIKLVYTSSGFLLSTGKLNVNSFSLLEILCSLLKNSLAEYEFLDLTFLNQNFEDVLLSFGFYHNSSAGCCEPNFALQVTHLYPLVVLKMVSLAVLF